MIDRSDVICDDDRPSDWVQRSWQTKMLIVDVSITRNAYRSGLLRSTIEILNTVKAKLRIESRCFFFFFRFSSKFNHSIVRVKLKILFTRNSFTSLTHQLRDSKTAVWILKTDSSIRFLCLEICQDENQREIMIFTQDFFTEILQFFQNCFFEDQISLWFDLKSEPFLLTTLEIIEIVKRHY